MPKSNTSDTAVTISLLTIGIWLILVMTAFAFFDLMELIPIAAIVPSTVEIKLADIPMIAVLRKASNMAALSLPVNSYL